MTHLHVKVKHLWSVKVDGTCKCTVPGSQKDLLLEQDNLKHNLVTVTDMLKYKLIKSTVHAAVLSDLTMLLKA